MAQTLRPSATPPTWSGGHLRAISVVLDDIAQKLNDPTFVHINMLRGGIAMLTDAKVKHLYPHLFEKEPVQ